MKKLKNIMLTILICSTIIIVGGCCLYNYSLTPVKNTSDTIIIDIPKGSSVKKIATILKENKLIKNEKVFLIYVKLMSKKELNFGKYEIAYNSGVKKIVKLLEEKNTYNPDEVTITFKEGINMRDIARVISSNTNNSYDSVINKSNDLEYINSLIDKYWFITNDILNNDLYYKLEGYLFPNTYKFNNKSVTVEEIFNKMLNEMAKVLEPFKEDIDKNDLTIHQILTLASMVEKEATGNLEERKNVASVFINRINIGMSLGSDVTAYYANKIDNVNTYIKETCGGSNCINYGINSPYNTREANTSMHGKLPVGPIATISRESLKAAINPNNTDYLFFIANIKTKETFFFKYSSDFNKKKVELKIVNGGL